MGRSGQPERRWWIWTLVAVALAGLVGFGVAVAMIVVPPVLANLRTHVSEEGVPLILHEGATSATVQVPPGWLVSPIDDGHASVATPDRGMTVQLSLDDSAPDAVMATLGATGVLVEPLPTGTTAAHGAPSGESDAALVAAVSASGGSVVLRVITDDLPLYRPALAEVLAGVAP